MSRNPKPALCGIQPHDLRTRRRQAKPNESAAGQEHTPLSKLGLSPQLLVLPPPLVLVGWRCWWCWWCWWCWRCWCWWC
jgi:hypothetical protein